eukprot:9497826-Pyramimonas_sp.AAC.3
MHDIRRTLRRRRRRRERDRRRWPTLAPLQAKRHYDLLVANREEVESTKVKRRMAVASAALFIKGHATCKDGVAYTDNFKVVMDSRDCPPIPLEFWCAQLKFKAWECLAGEDFDQFVDIIRPWPTKDPSEYQLDYQKPSLFALSVLRADGGEKDEKTLVELLGKTFFCDEFERMLKSPDTSAAENLSRAINIDLQRHSSGLADGKESLIHVMNDIHTVCLCVLGLCVPRPTTGAYAAAKTMLAPELKSSLGSDCANVAETLKESEVWGKLADKYWSQSPVDDKVAADYDTLMDKLGADGESDVAEWLEKATT